MFISNFINLTWYISMTFGFRWFVISILFAASLAQAKQFIDCTTKTPTSLDQLCIDQGPSGPYASDVVKPLYLTNYGIPILAAANQLHLSNSIYEAFKKNLSAGLDIGQQMVDVMYIDHTMINGMNNFSDLNRQLFKSDFQYMHVDLMTYPIHKQINVPHGSRSEAYRYYIWMASMQAYLSNYHPKNQSLIDTNHIRIMMRTAIDKDRKKSDADIDKMISCMTKIPFGYNTSSVSAYRRYLTGRNTVAAKGNAIIAMKLIDKVRQQCRQ